VDGARRLLPARRVVAKNGIRTRLGLVVCGGNATVITSYAGQTS
jgi:hypothetical protein